MIDKAIVSVMCIIVFVAVLVTMTGFAADIIRKIEFDNMCREAMYEIDLNGGLSIEIYDNLKSKLVKRDFYEIEITGGFMVAYGEKINFNVLAKSRTFAGNISQINDRREVVFVYDREFVSRKIHNMQDP